MRKSKIYLDQNIYIDLLESKKDRDLVSSSKDKFNYYYSPAHIEEIYKTEKVSNEKLKCLMDLINEITDKKELLLGIKGINTIAPLNAIFAKKEDANSCLGRVRGSDTREFVKKTSTEKLKVGKENFTKIRSEDKHAQNISNLCEMKIWENKHIIKSLKEFNQNSKEKIESNNKSHEVAYCAEVWGADTRLSNFLRLKKDSFSELNSKHAHLEFILELLFDTLSNNGYNRDKSVQTAISGTHDTTHAIYATQCDYLVSEDKKFKKRCAAVYHFLGVHTRIISYKEFLDLCI